MDSAQPITAPGLANKVAVSLVMTQRFTGGGIKTFAGITGQRYALGTDGKPIKVGSVVNKQWSDVTAAAGTDPALATALAAIEAAVQAYITAAQLV